jgi:cytochrome P450
VRQQRCLVASPELVQRVVAADQKAFIKGTSVQAATPLLGKGLISSDGELHDRQRRLIQPLFHRELIARYAEGMAQAAEAHEREWSDGDEVDLQAQMRRLTLAILGRSLFSADLRSDADPITQAVEEAIAYSRLMIFPGPTVMKLLPEAVKRRMNRSAFVLDEIIDRLIQERLVSPNGGTDMISRLLDPEANGSSPDGLQQIRDEVATMILAGHETTATTLALAWALLATHPVEAERFHEELHSVLGGRAPEFEDLERLPYTNAIVNETLRLYPPSWSFTRVTVDEFELGGEVLAPGTVLMLSAWVIHRKPELYEDPAEFRPERWLDGSTDSLPKYAFMPFGGGPRKCIGAAFAATEAAMILATLGQRWEMRLTRGEIEVQALFTTQPVDGLPATVHVRGGNGRRSVAASVRKPARVVRSRGRLPGGWTSRSAFHRARAVLRDEGVRSLWFRALSVTVYRRMLLLNDPVDNAPSMPEAGGGPVEFRALELDEIDEYLRLRPDHSEAETRSRMTEGQLCFAALEDGRVVQALWLAPPGTARIEFLDLEVPLARGETYAYDLFAAPHKRGANLFREHIAAIFSFFDDMENRRRWFPLTLDAPKVAPSWVASFHVEDGVWAWFVRMGWCPREIIGYVGAGRFRWRFRRRVRNPERLLRSAEKRTERRRRRLQRNR